MLGVLLSERAFAGQASVLMIVVDDINEWVGCLGGGKVYHHMPGYNRPVH